jgi:hypothetical protein
MKKIILILFCIHFLESKCQWFPSSYPQNFTSFDQVDFLNKDTIWGVEFNGVVASYDGGQTFIRKSSNLIQLGVNAFHVKQKLYYINNGIFESLNQGINWTKVQIVNDLGDTIYKGNVYQAHIFPNEAGFALGSFSNGNYRLFKTLNGGLSWVELDSSKIAIPKFEQGQSPIFKGKVYCFDSTCIMWNIREKNRFWVFTNFGGSVKEFDCNSRIDSDIRSFAFSDMNNGICITNNRSVYRIENDFSNFIYQGQSPTNIDIDFGKSINPKNSFYIIGGSGGIGSYYSLDTGKTWQNIGDNHSHGFLKMFNSTIGISSISSSNQSRIKMFDYIILGNADNIKKQNLTLFPNPVSDILNLVIFENSINSHIKIYSASGQCVIEQKGGDNINVENLKSGVYSIQLSVDNGISVKKFIKL